MTFPTLNDALNYHQQKFEVIKRLETIITEQGYQMIEPAYFENYDHFIKMHQRIEKTSMVKLIDAEGNIRVLRPDITTSIMKDLIPKWHNGLKLKLFYNTTVFVNTKAGIKEQKQFGVEYLGPQTPTTDSELIAIILEIFNDFNLAFILEVSHADFLHQLIDNLALDHEQIDTLKDIIYHKNRYALNKFIDKNLNQNPSQQVLATLFDLQGTLEVIDDKLANIDLPENIKTTLAQLANYQSQFKNDAVTFDLSMLSQYDYYSGLIFKGYLANVPSAVLNGGRYNTQAMGYKKSVPAIGFSFSLAALLQEVMKNNG